MKHRIYIAGPMTDLADLNFPAFAAEAIRLRALGHDVVNPAELNPDQAMAWHECMRRDIAALVTCDSIQLLPGWQASKGATLEHHIADRLGLTIYETPIAPCVTAVEEVPGAQDRIDQEMMLPEDRQCGQCKHHSFCVRLFGCPPTNTRCDWHRSRFVAAAAEVGAV